MTGKTVKDHDLDRLQMLEALKFVFRTALPRHFNLTHDIFSMMKAGYVGRSPSWGQPCMTPVDSAMQSAALNGPSGTGKTVSIRRVLRLIDQVILHTKTQRNHNCERNSGFLASCRMSSRCITQRPVFRDFQEIG